MKIIYLLTLIFSINALTFFWSDDENEFFKVKCNPTSPKSDNRDFYSIGSDRLPKRNGSEYVYSARDVADEVFKIVFAKGGNLNLAFGKCSQALVMVGNGSTKPCEKYLSTLQYNDGLQSNLRNNEKYKKPEFQDGFYEECKGDFVSERYTLSNGGYFDNLREVFDDKTHFIQERIFYENNSRVWEEDYYTYGLYRDGQKLLYGGPGEINEINNLRTRKNYKDGELHGAYEVYFPNGQLLYRLNYVEGKIEDGVYPIYKSDGTFTDLVYKDGFVHEGLYRNIVKLDGFYGFATKALIPFKDGKKVDGTYEEFSMYKLANGTGHIKKKKFKYTIKDGYYHGTFTEWFPKNEKSKNGRYQKDTQYVNGVKDGYETEWFYHDQVYTQQYFINGKRFGFFWRYFSNGEDDIPRGKKEFTCYVNDIKGSRFTNQVDTDLGDGKKTHKCLDPDKNDGVLTTSVN